MTERNKSKKFFTDLVSSNKNLTSDEPSMLTKIMAFSVILFLIIDLIIIVFYIKTNNRLENIKNHNYTQVITQSISSSTKRHNEYSQKVLKTMIADRNNMRSIIDDLQYFARDIEKLKDEEIKIDSLERLDEAFESFNLKNGVFNVEELIQVVKVYADIEKEMKKLNNYLLPIDLYDENEQSIQNTEEFVRKNLKFGMKLFLERLTQLDTIQTENQSYLSQEIDKSIMKFETNYKTIYKNKKFMKINNYYVDNFHFLNGTYVSFTKEYGKKFGAQLTRENVFDLKKKSRAYYCVLQGFLISVNTFDVMFQYVDKGNNDPNKKEEIVFQSERLRGGFKNPYSYSEAQTFELSPGKHSLYLRIIAIGGASQLYLRALRLECISYRNF